MTADGDEKVARLSEVVSALSLTSDLATGQPLEHGLRRALLAVWLGEELGLGEAELSDVYYVALLGSVGCTMEAAAFSRYVEDEIAVGGQLGALDPTRPLEVAAFFLRRAGAGEPPLTRARKIIAVARAGPSESAIVCRDVALQVGEMLNMGEAVSQAIGECHEHWNGKGWPRQLAGEEISLPARIYHVAHDADIFYRAGGVEAAITVARRRTGKVYEPRIAWRFISIAASLMQRLESEPAWDAVLDAEPRPARSLSAGELDDLVQAIADFVDSRSAYTLGHSPAVASLAESAALGVGLSEGETVSVRRAGLLHDVGRAGVPVALWDKDSRLTTADWERIKRHPSLTELVLARSTALGPLGMLAGLHHERLDGSGYRGVPASFLPVAARILSVADAYQSKLESRPHRAAMRPEEAGAAIQSGVDAGKFDGDITRAVLAAAGHASPQAPREWPADLTDREVEVLRLAARGLSNREMAEQLVVSPKTIGHHVENIYDKIGVSTRVGATLFAVRHGLIPG